MTTSKTIDLDFSISSSWDVECKNSILQKTISINTSNKSVDLEDVVRLDTCVHLVQCGDEKPTDPCSVTIAMSEQSTQLVSRVVIVSEARIVELFGSCGEYLTTCTAEYVDDFEDCAVYMADCVVKPSRELLIKKTKHEDSLWLYGINLQLCQTRRSTPGFSSVNFQSVNEMLKEAKVPLSENAEKCKSFLQAYGGGSVDNAQLPFKSKMPNPQMLVKMLEAGYFQSFGETGKNVSKCISNLVPFLTRDVESKLDLCGGDKNNSEQQSDALAIRKYIDQRLSQLESRIDSFEQHMKELEIRQNEKLDCIIALLNKPNS